MINENDPSTLTTSGRLLNYNNAIKDGLQTGLRFTELMDQLIKTTDPDELVTAATELADFTLDSDFVTFPINIVMLTIIFSLCRGCWNSMTKVNM